MKEDNPFIIEDPYASLTPKTLKAVVDRVGKRLEETWMSPPNRNEELLEHLYLSSAKKSIHTAFFSIDLRGFTKLSYKKEASELKELIGAFSSSLSSLIDSSGGAVLKYVGDAVLAFFPTKLTSTSVERALLLASATTLFMDRYFLPWATERDMETHYGIGIDVGEAAIVKLGSPSGRIAYDLISKAANVSVKLQAMAKRGETITTARVKALAESFTQYFTELTPPSFIDKLLGRAPRWPESNLYFFNARRFVEEEQEMF